MQLARFVFSFLDTQVFSLLNMRFMKTLRMNSKINTQKKKKSTHAHLHKANHRRESGKTQGA